MNINKVILMGRLTADPELKVSAQNVPVVRFTVAVNRRFQSKTEGAPTADFLNCTAFRQTAEFVSKYFRKGSSIIVFGSIQNDNYTDRDGNKRYDWRIMVDEVQFGESKGTGSSSGQQYGGAPDKPKNEPEAYSNAISNDFFSDIKDIEDELPF